MDIEHHYTEAGQWIERRRWDMAQQAIQRGFALEPDHAGLRYLQAYVDYHGERNQQALDTLDDLLVDEPEDFDAHLLRARVLRDLGQLGESERALLDLLRANPANAQLLAHYAMTMLRAGQVDKADGLLREAMRLAPEDTLVLTVAALNDMAHGRPVREGRPLDALVRSEPDAELSLRLMAYSLFREHKLGAAEEAVRALVRLSPGDASNIQLAAAIRYNRHWSMLPLYPIMRWGWGASIAIYVGVFVALRAARGVVPEHWINAFVLLWLAYVIYSWVWPGLLKRWKFPELRD
jgi:predicted Zn-dependent protease